jgi:hypothetical protein
MEMSLKKEDPFAESFVRSIRFTEKIVGVMTEKFGEKAARTAEKIVTATSRLAWSHASPEEWVGVYTAKTQFEIRFLNEMEKTVGEDVEKVLKSLVAKDEHSHWAAIAKTKKSRTLDDFFRLLWDPLPLMGFECTGKKQGDMIQGIVTRCPVYELSRHIGGEKWLYILACERDFHNIRGFNPDIRLEREQTLMQGDATCTFNYTMINPEPLKGEIS